MKEKPVAENWPEFDASLLQEVSAAFLRRRKAIAYHAGLRCERSFSESADRSLQPGSGGVLTFGV